MQYTDLMSPHLAFKEEVGKEVIGVPVSMIMKDGLMEQGIPVSQVEAQQSAPMIGEQMLRGVLANTNN